MPYNVRFRHCLHCHDLASQVRKMVGRRMKYPVILGEDPIQDVLEETFERISDNVERLATVIMGVSPRERIQMWYPIEPSKGNGIEAVQKLFID